MPQHVRGDNLGPVRQVHLGGTLTASSRQPRRPGPPRAPPRQRAPVPGVPPRPAAEDRVRERVDRLWRQAAPRLRNPQARATTLICWNTAGPTVAVLPAGRFNVTL